MSPCAASSTGHIGLTSPGRAQAPSPPTGKRFPGQSLARGGCSWPRCADEGILARACSRKSFQDLLGQCQLAGSCPARAGRDTGGTRPPHSPGPQGDPGVTPGQHWAGEALSAPLTPGWVPLLPCWKLCMGKGWDRELGLCRFQMLVDTDGPHTHTQWGSLWGTVCGAHPQHQTQKFLKVLEVPASSWEINPHQL